MKKTLIIIAIFILILTSFHAVGHVPFLELSDFSEEKPFVVRKSILQSIAVYSWLETDNVNPSKDIDVFKFKVRIPDTRIYIELIGPVCDGYYKNFTPWFALVGPDLPDPGQSLPFDIPVDYGAIIKENVQPGQDREQFFEPFGNKWYYSGPIVDIQANKTGTYYVYVWDPYENGGDYVAVLGRSEIFGIFDIFRALIYTPMIRLGWELHI